MGGKPIDQFRADIHTQRLGPLADDIFPLGRTYFHEPAGPDTRMSDPSNGLIVWP
jgi:hypothetical protein